MNWPSTRRTGPVYIVLGAIWLAVVVWQTLEHLRVREVAREALVSRGRDITSTLGIVLRSHRRFGGVIFKEQLEAAMRELIRPGDLDGVAVMSPNGDTAASAGTPIEVSAEILQGSGVHWARESLTLTNPIDLGDGPDPDSEDEPRPSIIISGEMVPNPFSSTNRFRRRGDDRDRDRREEDEERRRRDEAGNNEPDDRRMRENGGDDDDRRGDRRRWIRPPFGRPPWMSEEDYQAVIQRQGVHSFMIALSTQPLRSAASQDLWMRLFIALLTSAAAGFSALAWRNLVKSSDLQIRLVRAGEMNAHLKEMNLAAAGLAHETRNPLNIIRGFAQMISRQEKISGEVKDRSVAIMEEADRVTAQLNEFINYSRPREVRRTAVSLKKLIDDVARALSPDAEDKGVTIATLDDERSVEADEQLLRQALFNLIMNAVQAVEADGQIGFALIDSPDGEVTLEIRDDGPGVPPEMRREIFKPYITTHQKGTGLGLAVVHQIVSAHGWEIGCGENHPSGAVFRISHMKLSSQSRHA